MCISILRVTEQEQPISAKFAGHLLCIEIAIAIVNCLKHSGSYMYDLYYRIGTAFCSQSVVIVSCVMLDIHSDYCVNSINHLVFTRRVSVFTVR